MYFQGKNHRASMFPILLLTESNKDSSRLDVQLTGNSKQYLHHQNHGKTVYADVLLQL